MDSPRLDDDAGIGPDSCTNEAHQRALEDLQQARACLKVQNTVASVFRAKLSMIAACRLLGVELCEQLGWDSVGVWTLDSSSWTLRCTESWQRPEVALANLERASRAAALGPGTGLPGRVWSTAKICWVTDADTFAEVEHGVSRTLTVMPPVALEAGLRTALCFPLKCGDDVLAVVEVFSRVRRQPDPIVMELLETSGDQLALWELRERAEVCARVAERDADHARSQLESVLACTPALITAIDRKGKVVFVNKTTPPGREAAVVGAPWQHVFSLESQPKVESGLRSLFSGGPPLAYESRVAHPDGQWLWYTNYMGPMRNADSVVGAVIISQDVTESKRSEAELLVAQRMAAVGTLAAGVAHEINTPVQFVNDSVHFLRDASVDVFLLVDALQRFHELATGGADAQAIASASRSAADAERTADLEYLRANVPKAFERCIDGLERVASIVRSMKEFSHPAQKEMAPVDLNRAIMATLTVARNEYKYLADLDTQLGPIPAVHCHANDINQVVLNIVVNAAHAIADSPQKNKRGLITVSTKQEGESVLIAVSDTGGGIPEAIRPRIFDPFFTTKEVGRGTGQGLAIARTAIEKHGGELRFETTMGVGTTFYIRLPIAGQPRRTSSMGSSMRASAKG